MKAKIISQKESHTVRYLQLEVLVNGKTIWMDTEWYGVNLQDCIAHTSSIDLWNSLTLEENELVRKKINAYYTV